MVTKTRLANRVVEAAIYPWNERQKKNSENKNPNSSSKEKVRVSKAIILQVSLRDMGKCCAFGIYKVTKNSVLVSRGMLAVAV